MNCHQDLHSLEIPWLKRMAWPLGQWMSIALIPKQVVNSMLSRFFQGVYIDPSNYPMYIGK